MYAVTYLNARVKTINPRKKIGINLCSLGSANGFFLALTSKAPAVTGKTR